MVIGRKRGARDDLVLPRSLSPRSSNPFFFFSLLSSSFSSTHFHLLSPSPRSTITRKGHFAAFARLKRAIMATLPSPGRRRYFLRIKIFQIYEVVFSSARLREWFFPDPPGFDVSIMKKNALTRKIPCLRKLFFYEYFIKIIAWRFCERFVFRYNLKNCAIRHSCTILLPRKLSRPLFFSALSKLYKVLHLKRVSDSHAAITVIKKYRFIGT